MSESGLEMDVMGLPSGKPTAFEPEKPLELKREGACRKADGDGERLRAKLGIVDVCRGGGGGGWDCSSVPQRGRGRLV